MAYLFLQRYQDAQKAFDQAIKLDKDAPEAYNNRGFIEQMKKNSGKAIKYYTRRWCCGPTRRPSTTTSPQRISPSTNSSRLRAEYRTAYQLDPGIFQRVSSIGIMAQTSSPEDRAAFSFMVAKMYAQAGDFDHSILNICAKPWKRATRASRRSTPTRVRHACAPTSASTN